MFSKFTRLAQIMNKIFKYCCCYDGCTNLNDTFTLEVHDIIVKKNEQRTSQKDITTIQIKMSSYNIF